jgi:hypothetical protein
MQWGKCTFGSVCSTLVRAISVPIQLNSHEIHEDISPSPLERNGATGRVIEQRHTSQLYGEAFIEDAFDERYSHRI